MEFPTSFFEDEDRCGFLVPAQMKRCWAAALEVLDDIAQVCERHNLDWFAGWGTLLGTIRHAGFIPWDDDLDIYMKRQDYEVFLRVAEQELPDNYSLLNSHNDAGYDQFLTRVISGRKLALSPDIINKYHGFRYITGVDIFPLDYISRNRQEDELQRMMIQGCIGAFKTLSDAESSVKEREEFIGLVEELANVKIVRDGTEAVQIFGYADKLMQLCDEKDAEYITMMPLWVTHGNMRFHKEDFEKSVWMPFEHVSIRVPIGYASILRTLYGKYWEYARSWNAHDYPYYKDMARQVKDILGYSPTVFTYNRAQHEACLKVRKLIRDSWQQSDTKTVLFLPWKGYMWESMAGLYRAAVNSGYRVIVSPVVFADRDLDRNPTEYIIDTDMIPSEVILTAPDELDIQGLHPDMIFIQYPYDEYNDACVSDERYFARNLFRYTPELIYIPPFDMDDIYSDDMRGREFFPDFGIVPGVFYADKVYLQSEVLRDLYVREWTQLAGDDTAAVWEDKIRYCGNIRDDEIVIDVYSMFDIPDEWDEYIIREDGSRRDAIMYHLQSGLPSGQGEVILRKLEDDIRIMNKYRDDYAFLWYQDESLDTYFNEVRPDLNNAYLHLKERFVNEHTGILDDSGDIVRAVTVSRAYIGDPGSLVPVYKRAGRPVMLRVPELIYNDPSQNVEGHLYPYKGAVLGEYYYFISMIWPGLYRLDLNTAKTELACELPERNTYGRTAYGSMGTYKDRLLVIPSRADKLVIYEPSSDLMNTVDFRNDEESKEDFNISCADITGGYVFLFKYNSDTVIRINLDNNIVERKTGWGKALKYPFAPCSCTDDGEYVYAGNIREDCFARVHIKDFTVDIQYVANSDTRYYGLGMNGDRLWMTPYTHGRMLGIRPDMSVPPIEADMGEIAPRGVTVSFHDLVFEGNDIILFPMHTSSFYRYNITTGRFKPEYLGMPANRLKYRDPGIDGPVESHAIKEGDSVYVLLHQRSELLIYDCKRSASRTIPLMLPDEMRTEAEGMVMDYMTGGRIPTSVYKEQRYFGLPEFIRHMREISPEYHKMAEEHHVGRDILDDIRRDWQ